VGATHWVDGGDFGSIVILPYESMIYPVLAAEKHRAEYRTCATIDTCLIVTVWFRKTSAYLEISGDSGFLLNALTIYLLIIHSTQLNFIRLSISVRRSSRADPSFARPHFFLSNRSLCSLKT
jgi:hypothetical protein